MFASGLIIWTSIQAENSWNLSANFDFRISSNVNHGPVVGLGVGSGAGAVGSV